VKVTLELDARLVSRLEALARSRKIPRDTLVREAIAEWLARGCGVWPDLVLSFEPEPTLPPFESWRDED